MKKYICLFLFAIVCGLQAQAQCSSKNTAFGSGETLIYDLYFNWKFVWIKAGTASMNITRTTYNGQPAYKSYLITRGSKRADDIFKMRDTLTAYTTLDLVPQYYKKGSFEGKTYRKEEVWYSYPNGQCKVKMRYQRDNNAPKISSHTSKYCAFDMISMLLRARSFNPEGWKKGKRVNFPITDGTKIINAMLEYKGKTTVKADNGVKYRCLQLSYMEYEDGKYKEIVRFYVSDDANHVPVRLDMFLKFGSAKAFLVGAKGIKSKMTSIVK